MWLQTNSFVGKKHILYEILLLEVYYLYKTWISLLAAGRDVFCYVKSKIPEL